MKSLTQFALRGYKRWLSPSLLSSCRYVPTCSDYAIESIARHGAMTGSLMAALRVLRCHPFSRGGFDPVPQNSLFRKADVNAAFSTCLCDHSTAGQPEASPISRTVGIIARN